MSAPIETCLLGSLYEVETPGTSNLTAEQAAEMQTRYGFRYVAVSDGSRGGHTPGRAYGRGSFAASLKTKRTKRPS